MDLLTVIMSKRDLTKSDFKINKSIKELLKVYSENENLKYSEFCRVIIHLGLDEYQKRISKNLKLDQSDYFVIKEKNKRIR